MHHYTQLQRERGREEKERRKGGGEEGKREGEKKGERERGKERRKEGGRKKGGRWRLEKKRKTVLYTPTVLLGHLHFTSLESACLLFRNHQIFMTEPLIFFF